MKKYVIFLLYDKWFRVKDSFIKNYQNNYWVKFDKVTDINHILLNKKQMDDYLGFLGSKQAVLKIQVNTKDLNLESLKELVNEEVKNFKLLKEII